MKSTPGVSDWKGMRVAGFGKAARGAHQELAVKNRRQDMPENTDARLTAIVLADGEARRSCEQWLGKAGVFSAGVESIDEACHLLEHGDFDLLLIGHTYADMRPARRKRSPIQQLSVKHPLTAIVVIGDAPVFDDALIAMRSGATEYLPVETPGREAVSRIRAAIARVQKRREDSEKLHSKNSKLKRLCRGLSVSRRELNRQVSNLCEHLADAYKDLAGQMNLLKLSAHFETLVRQELDLESLLRVAVEFMLGRTGPTNAAVFLPATSGDLSLGAYVNYDCPRESHEMLLDQLACSVAPKFERDETVVRLATEQELHDRLGSAAEWLDGRAVAAFSCRQEDECLAVVTLFRDRSSPFTEEQTTELGVLGGLFAKQLARVIHIHHRHQPKKKWDTAGPDDIDLAA